MSQGEWALSRLPQQGAPLAQSPGRLRWIARGTHKASLNVLNRPLSHHIAALHISPQLLPPGLHRRNCCSIDSALPPAPGPLPRLCLPISSPRCHTHLCPMPTLPLLSLTAGVGTDIGPETCTHWLTVLGQQSLSDPPQFPCGRKQAD